MYWCFYGWVRECACECVVDIATAAGGAAADGGDDDDDDDIGMCVCVCGELHIYRCILFSVHKACPNIDIAWYMYNFGNKGRQNESDTIDNDESWSEMKQAIYCENMLM